MLLVIEQPDRSDSIDEGQPNGSSSYLRHWIPLVIESFSMDNSLPNINISKFDSRNPQESSSEKLLGLEQHFQAYSPSS